MVVVHPSHSAAIELICSFRVQSRAAAAAALQICRKASKREREREREKARGRKYVRPSYVVGVIYIKERNSLLLLFLL